MRKIDFILYFQVIATANPPHGPDKIAESIH